MYTQELKLQKIMIISVLVIFLLSVLGQIVSAETLTEKREDQVYLNWFVISIDDYPINGSALIVDFWWFEDMSLYVGEIAIIFDCDQNVYIVDEIVDFWWFVDPYTGEEYTQDQMSFSAEIVADELSTLLNNDLDYSVIFPEWRPESLYNDSLSQTDINRQVISDYYQIDQCTLSPVTFLPLLSN